MSLGALWPCLPVVILLITPFLFRQNSAFHYHGKFVLFYLYTSFMSVFCIPFFLFKWRNIDNSRIGAGLVAPVVTRLLGIEFELRNKEFLAEEKGGAIVVTNHQTTLDILGQFAVWHIPYRVAAVAKQELRYFWPFGLAAWLAGVVFIDRRSSKNSYRVLTEAAKLTGPDKAKIWFFAEGTRNKDANKTKKLLPLKRGAFKIAVDCQAPVIPLVYSPYYFLDINTYRFDPGRIIMKALPAIETKGLTDDDIPDLMERTAAVLQEAYSELFAEVEKSLLPSHPFLTGQTST